MHIFKFKRHSALIAVLTIAAAGALLALPAAAGAASSTVSNACSNSVTANFSQIEVTTSGDDGLTTVAPGGATTTTGLSQSGAVPGAIFVAGYNLGLLVEGPNTIPATVNTKIEGTNTTDLDPIAPGIQNTQTTNSVATSVQTTIDDPDNVPGTGDETATPATFTANYANLSWTAGASGTINYRQDSIPLWPATDLSNTLRIHAVVGGFLNVIFRCAPGTVTPPDPGTVALIDPAGSFDTTLIAAAPAVTSLVPNNGPAAGGNTVLINGTGFTGATGAAAVKFGANNATSYTVNGAGTQITAVAPAGTAGSTVEVTVTTPAGTNPTAPTTNNYTYNAPTPAPTVTQLVPNNGPTAGGNTVVITGTGFTGATGAAAVKFGANNATSYTVNSATQITAVAPAGAAGLVQVTVTTPAGTSSTAGAGNDYTYNAPTAAPTVTQLVPNNGPTAGGNTVVITGTGFTGATGAAAVKFGANNATSYTVNSATQITAVAPAGAAGLVQVTVTTPAGTSSTAGAGNDYTYNAPTAAPTVTQLVPNNGPTAGGNTVVITGTGFTGATGAAAVKFGANNATSYTVNSATQITAVAPAGAAGLVQVTVTTPAGTSSTAGAGNDYTYNAPTAAPTVTQLVPNNGPTAGGNTVVITGTGFTGATGAAAVKFGANNATSYTVNSATQITAVAPAGAAGLVQVTVTTPAGTSSTAGAGNDYTYNAPTAAPTVTSLNPNNGPAAGGNTVVITGTGFTGATGAAAVKFGANNATSYTVNSATQITAVAPAGAAGSTVEVTVTTPAGTSPTAGTGNNYTYNQVQCNAPSISKLIPNIGIANVGGITLIVGNNFTGATSVTFGTAPARSFRVLSDRLILAVARPAPAGTVHVRVTSPCGTSPITNADRFTFIKFGHHDDDDDDHHGH